MAKQDQPAAPAFKVKGRFEIDGTLFTPNGGPRLNGVYTDPTGKVVSHWYFQALFQDGQIVPANEEEAALSAAPVPAEEIAELMANATARNAEGAEPPSAQTKADNAAAQKAAEQTSKAMAKANAARQAAAKKAK